MDAKSLILIVTNSHTTFHKNTKMGNLMDDQRSGIYGCGFIQEGNCFWLYGNMVHHGHEMDISTRRWEDLQQIYIDVVEMAKSNLECHEWSPDVETQKFCMGYRLAQIITFLWRLCKDKLGRHALP